MRNLFIAIVAFATVAACTKSVTPLPPVPRPSPVRNPIVVYEKFRVGTFDFGSSGPSSSLATALPAVLLTELRNTGRFAVYEGGNLRNPETLNEGSAREFVDGYVSGTITSWNGEEVCVDMRLANATNHEVLYSSTACVPARAVAGTASIDRNAVKTVADDLARSIKKLDNASVLSAEGKLLIIDRGADVGVMRGMVAYLRGTGDIADDTKLHRGVTVFSGAEAETESADSPAVAPQLPAIVAEIVIVSVDDKTSIGVIYNGSYAMPGDTVFFK